MEKHVSESILDHGYIPEEHAPDPVIGHGDPTPPGKVAIWLFLASEIMFFIAILATYIIFRAGAPHLFAEMGRVLNKSLAAGNTLVLIFSSLTMALAVDAAQKKNQSRTILCLFLTLLCASTFMVIKYIEYANKLTHHTIVITQPNEAGKMTTYVYDGHVHEQTAADYKLEGFRAVVEQTSEEPFDIHWMSGEGVEHLAKMQAARGLLPSEGAGEEKVWTIEKARIADDLTYGPWKNNFFACYFTLTGIHGLHVLGGMVALAILLIQAIRGKLFSHHTEYVGLYWHFVDLVWIFLFPLLYLI
jgi:cytochrome c oxidase subunit 3